MINFDLIMEKTVLMTRDLVGQYLAELEDAGGAPTGIPAVIQARQKGPIPPLPYIVVDFTGVKDVDGWQVEVGTTVDDKSYTDKYLEFMVQFTCYADSNATGIIQELKNQFVVGSVRDRIESDTSARPQRSGDVIKNPVLQETDYRDIATMFVTYHIVDRVVHGSVIERVVGEGSVVDQEGIEVIKTSFDITAPQIP